MSKQGTDAHDPHHHRTTAPLARRSMAWRAAHLFALSGFAFAQPLFGLLEGQPDYWIARQATILDVLALVLVVVVLIPGFLFGITWIVDRVNRRAGWVVHLATVGVLAWIILMTVIDNVTGGDSGAALVLGLAAVGAGLFLIAYRSVKFVRDFLRILTIAPVVFVVLLGFRLPPLGGYGVPTVDAGISAENPVVVVVFDEFQLATIQKSDGTIDSSRYPGLASLAESATWYRYATTVHDDSLNAVPAILTGQLPEPQLLAVASDHPVNLFTVLGSTHTVVANEDITQLCPPSLCVSPDGEDSAIDRLKILTSDSAVVYLHTWMPSAWREGLPDIGARWGNFLAGDADVGVDTAPGSSAAALSELTAGEGRAVAYGQFLDSFDPALGPALYYLHVDLPHIPWTFVPSGSRYPELGIAGKDAHGYWMDDPWLVQQGYVRATLHGGFADRLISDTVDKLKALGMWDEALVVFVADHGEEFAVNQPRRSFTESNLVGMGSVPMFVKYPNQEHGVVDDTNSQTIDVLPTIVAELGGSLDDVDGVPLQGVYRPNLKTLISDEGKVYRPDLASFLDLDVEYRKRMLDLVPAGVGYGGMFEAVGPRPDLNGLAATALPSRVVEGRVTLSDESLFVNHDPSSGWDPVAVQFRIETSDPPEYWAVAINGTILATITPYGSSDSSASVLAIVPPGSFLAGDNDVQVYGISGSPGDTTLIRYE